MAKRQEEVDGLTDRCVDLSYRDAIRGDIAQRLRRVCSHLTEEDFGQLVEQMVSRQLRGERRANLL